MNMDQQIAAAIGRFTKILANNLHNGGMKPTEVERIVKDALEVYLAREVRAQYAVIKSVDVFLHGRAPEVSIKLPRVEDDNEQDYDPSGE